MSLDNALFLVDRAGTNYRSKGADIGQRMKSGDKVLVQRNNSQFKATYNGSSWDKIQDNDLLIVWDGTNNRKVSGANFKSLFSPTPTSCGTVRLIQTKSCPDGDDEIVVSYQENNDRTVVKIKGTEWLDSGMFVNGQDVWLNNSRYKISGLAEIDCNGPATRFYISGRVRGNEGQNGTPWHIHNCAAKVIAEWDWVPYQDGTAAYYYMCPGKKYYKKAGHAFSTTDTVIYASKTDKNGNDAYAKLKPLNGVGNRTVNPWLENDAGRVIRSYDSYNDHVYEVKSHYLSADGTSCAFKFGKYFGNLVENANSWIKLWDRNPRDYFLDYGFIRPSKDYGNIRSVRYESDITDEYMYTLDKNGSLLYDSTFYGLFIPHALLDRQIRGGYNAELYDGSFSRAEWRGTSNGVYYGQRTYNDVKGIYVYNLYETRETWNPMPIDIYGLKMKELWD